MAYWNTSAGSSAPRLDNFGSAGGVSSTNRPTEFYEYEPAVVLDIILDKNHPSFNSNPIDFSRWQADFKGKAPLPTDLDYTWVGRILVRMVFSHKNVEKEELIWAIPLESNISEYPLVNEAVAVVKYFDKYYYTKKINLFNTPNNNVNFNLETLVGGYKQPTNSKILGNRELIKDPNNPVYKDYVGPLSKTRPEGGSGYEGVMGRYFYNNSRIRALKRREGDTIVEGRFGNSIRFAAYDDNRENDKGFSSLFSGYNDYKGDGTDYMGSDGKPHKSGGGNPMILIRNRQRSLTAANTEAKIYENLPSIKGTEEEKNVGGYIVEDINNDGSSIHITSGATLSPFVTNCSKKMWGNGEEQAGYQPGGATKFVYPKLVGDQIVINSDRLVVQSRTGETFHYSKKRYAVVTDSEYTVDAHDQIVFNTNQKTVINSPAIYLGEYDVTDEPALLGQTTINWLYDLCEWLKAHTHFHAHGHYHHYSGVVEETTQLPKQKAELIVLQKRLNLLLSRRVFITGGGFAPGKNGAEGSFRNGPPPVRISIPSGANVPGGWKGKDKR